MSSVTLSEDDSRPVDPRIFEFLNGDPEGPFSWQSPEFRHAFYIASAEDAARSTGLDKAVAACLDELRKLAEAEVLEHQPQET